MPCCRLSPCAGTRFCYTTSQKRGRHAVARRGRAGALARRSVRSAVTGTSAKVVCIIMSPRFCAFRPRRRESAAPTRSAETRQNAHYKYAKIKEKRRGFRALRWRRAHQGRDMHALNALETVRTRPLSTFPDTWNVLGDEHARLCSLVT